MTRTITVTDASHPALGETITGRSYRLLAADGVTVLSTNDPPYSGVTESPVIVEQTATQSDAQANTVQIPIPGRVVDLAASNAVRPVLTWTDVLSPTAYEIHRGAPGFVIDVIGGTTRIATLASNVATYTDGSIVGDGVTQYAYRVVATTVFGYVVSNPAVSTPAAPTVEYTTDFAAAGSLTAYSPAWVLGPAFTSDPLVSASGAAQLRGDGCDGALYDPVVPASADQSIAANAVLWSQLPEEIWLIFRAAGVGTSSALVCYAVRVTSDGTSAALEIVYNNGGQTVLASAPLGALTLGQSYQLFGSVFDANGAVQLTAHFGPVSLSTSDPSSRITTAGRRGLYGVASADPSSSTGLTLLDYTAT